MNELMMMKSAESRRSQPVSPDFLLVHAAVSNAEAAARKTAPRSMPVELRMEGSIARMQATARKPIFPEWSLKEDSPRGNFS